MVKNATAKSYVVPAVIGAPLHAVIVDGEVRLIDPKTEEDIDDIRASEEASREPGERISIKTLRRQLGI